MAKFNLDYYGGSDLYSDGDVENEILAMVRSGQDVEQMEHVKFPVLYHLSRARENILNWYPFRKDASCLEIGSGCGAITGLLCRKLGQVTSVELSKRRAEINFARNSRMENLEICVGNLNDMDFRNKFDYVILNGVFEYAMSFTPGAHPYETFLMNVSQFLKPEGILLVAIENRLGLKYFAGAPEDHTDGYFDGIKEYENNSSVRTFSRQEWMKLMESCGLGHYRFYYPYPDYKFPREIFTDESLGEQKYGRPAWNFTKHRMALFNEGKMAASLQESGVMAQFANSFLIEMSKKPLPGGDRVLYAKLGTDRSLEYAIGTVILERNGQRMAAKHPMTEAAASHIEKMSRPPQTGGSWQPLTGKLEDGVLIYPWLTAESLDVQAGRMISAGDPEGLKCILDQAARLCRSLGRYTDAGCGKDAGVKQGAALSQAELQAFHRVFGPGEIPGDARCAAPANIDLILDNIFETGGQYQVIDCEWMFDFPVPADYILWRSINELYTNYPALERLAPRKELLPEYGINEEMAALCWQWDTYFTEVYVGANRLLNRSEPVTAVSLEELRQRMHSTDRIGCSLYLDTGGGFTEEQKLSAYLQMEGDRFTVAFDVQAVSRVRALRFDPLEGDPCICRIDKNGTTGSFVPVNAAARISQGDLFLTEDPIYQMKGKAAPEKKNGGQGQVVICGSLTVLSREEALARADQLLQSRLGTKLTHRLGII